VPVSLLNLTPVPNDVGVELALTDITKTKSVKVWGMPENVMAGEALVVVVVAIDSYVYAIC